jgi:hypothetical protein
MRLVDDILGIDEHKLKKKCKVPLVLLFISRTNSNHERDNASYLAKLNTYLSPRGNIYTSEALGHIIFSEKARLAYACYAIQKEQKVLRK